MRTPGRRATCVVMLAFITGCSVHGTDRTEQDRPLDSQQMCTVQIEIKRDPFVIASSIRVAALIDGTLYPLGGHGEGIWSGKVPAACRVTPLGFSYQIDWKYLALLVPISDRKTIPADGALEAHFIQPPPFQAPDEVLLYGTKPMTQPVEIRALHPAGVTLLGVSIGPPPQGSCSFGDCTGTKFTLSDVPGLPYTIPCGDTIQFNVNFGSTVQSSGVLTVTTDQGSRQIPLSGKIFLFP